MIAQLKPAETSELMIDDAMFDCTYNLPRGRKKKKAKRRRKEKERESLMLVKNELVAVDTKLVIASFMDSSTGSNPSHGKATVRNKRALWQVALRTSISNKRMKNEGFGRREKRM